jgi:hypothetical protein
LMMHKPGDESYFDEVLALKMKNII